MRAPLAALLLLALPATALSAEETATEALRARDAEIRAALPPAGSEVTPATRKRVENIITRIVDVHAMVESAMAARWKQITEAQRKRLVTAFENRFRSTSGSEFDTYRSTEVAYEPEKVEAGRVVVPTRVVVKGEPTDITYAMRQEGGAWRIVDIVIDGVSTVDNYRSSFARVISKEGVEGLIARLEKGPSTGRP
ncbi:MAG TPA: ABC transporter substrate-binding protein [Anaeromyxobacteraceae bacterium]|nr:ABC transporter substrate-binding protein [Anaeromyxobacteraceae bacterium]